jgi:nucleotidyltransferase substrate binding protein (TIGR01987 family)
MLSELVSSTAAKPVIREMAQSNLISDVQLWFWFVEARNKSSHTYNKKIAEEVFATIYQFLPEAKKFRINLDKV